MRCLHPLALQVDGRREFVPCGKCNFCLQAKRADWSFRLGQEFKVAKTAKFLTLTYDEDHIPINSLGYTELCKKDFQLFMKRIRKRNAELVDWPLRYYAVGEYGTKTMRPHYHAIMFNLHEKVNSDLIDIWNLGHILSGSVSPASIHYVTKYVVNRVADFGDRAPPFSLMSRRPGIGSNYVGTHTSWHKSGLKGYGHVNGIMTRLPRYYKDKIFDKDEKAIMSAVVNELSDYKEEIARLSKLHDDPYDYYNERLRSAHDRVTSKVNDNSKF